MRILIVEDNRQMREMIKSIIADIADHVDECGEGEQALALYERGRPDWVLMDLKIKEADGIQVTRQIKSAFPDAKIVVVTNYDDADLKQAARLAGACEYVNKRDLLSVRRILLRS